ncbi:hypothetical protein GTO10_04610 [Candidatus Saccharibacteria bacterium]|nr:hypothetical protein [Candidatus Saccharibacteria bacterium]
MQVLYAEGKLTAEQELFMASTRPEEELYCLPNDPYELQNVVKSAEYKGVLKKLRAVFDAWIKRTGDQGGIAEDPRIGVIAYQDVQKYYEPEQKKRGLAASASPAEYLRYWEKRFFPSAPEKKRKK